MNAVGAAHVRINLGCLVDLTATVHAYFRQRSAEHARGQNVTPRISLAFEPGPDFRKGHAFAGLGELISTFDGGREKIHI
jgi:hypothetical protein